MNGNVLDGRRKQDDCSSLVPFGVMILFIHEDWCDLLMGWKTTSCTYCGFESAVLLEETWRSLLFFFFVFLLVYNTIFSCSFFLLLMKRKQYLTDACGDISWPCLDVVYNTISFFWKNENRSVLLMVEANACVRVCVCACVSNS